MDKKVPATRVSFFLSFFFSTGHANLDASQEKAWAEPFYTDGQSTVWVWEQLFGLLWFTRELHWSCSCITLHVRLMVHCKPVGSWSRFIFFCTLCSGLFQLSGKAVRLVLLIFLNGEFRQWLKATTKASRNSVARLDGFLPSDKISSAWQNLSWFWISSVFCFVFF